MTSAVSDRRATARPPRGGADVPVRLRPVATGRRPVLALAAVLLVLVSTAVVVDQFEAAGHTAPVLVLSRTIAAGGVLSSDDLVTARVHVPPGVGVVAAASEPAVIGRPVAERLSAGSLLAPGELGRAGPAQGEAVVGLAAAPAQLPADGVTPGASVDVVVTTSSAAGTAVAPIGSAASGVPAPGTVVATDATVLAVNGAGANQQTVVSVAVPVGLAPVLTELSATGSVALVLVGAP